ncbi:hypothetical protein SARC_05395 [Sphaeroforma arctica JP610]|uniref:Anti-proliferative protein domain-containing protein n=1 Tax=Sphaeroforma arctica JP610 TaxID=667725 RepID=A0A0L0G282_9EUKA|nr:hypothetical protein SARC_05395 [Sphaeroforma arctica JP610]KNC82303.1 hypothetical protein SARC_05395 [Sphaeroforma arctica JP610]|eukprot:XP_014156205.1 hypothetical protein SARC_05395 [Sphaeroforma arctica JP610]
MIEEVNYAVMFIGDLLRQKGLSDDIVMRFEHTLSGMLVHNFRSTWFVDQPHRGSGNRCLRIERGQMDPSLANTARSIGVSIIRLQNLLPTDITIWIDPKSVCYRSERSPLFSIYDEEDFSSGDSDSSNSSGQSAGKRKRAGTSYTSLPEALSAF